MADVAATSGAPQRDFQFFVDIIDACRRANASAEDGNLRHIKVGPFLEGMTIFLRIFDAFNNPLFTEGVKRDVLGNIGKLRTASAKTKADTLEGVIEAELEDAKLAKLIRKELGEGQHSGTVGLLWMKRTMQFVCGLLTLLLEDPSISLASASRKSYSKTLKFCHNLITRGAFDTALRFAPAREAFYKNLTGGQDVSKVGQAFHEYLDVFKPQVDAIVELFDSKRLEVLIETN